LAGAQPAPFKEDETPSEEELREAWERLQREGGPPKLEVEEDEKGLLHLKVAEDEREEKSKRGRPPKEEPQYTKEEEIERLKNVMRDALWTLVNKFGWEVAGKVLDEVVEEFREYAPDEG